MSKRKQYDYLKGLSGVYISASDAEYKRKAKAFLRKLAREAVREARGTVLNAVDSEADRIAKELIP